MMQILFVLILSLLLVCATAVPQWWPYSHGHQPIFNAFYDNNQNQQSLYMSSIMLPGYNSFAVAQSSNYGGYPYDAQQQSNNFLAFPGYPSHSAAAAAVASSGSYY